MLIAFYSDPAVQHLRRQHCRSSFYDRSSLYSILGRHRRLRPFAYTLHHGQLRRVCLDLGCLDILGRLVVLQVYLLSSEYPGHQGQDDE